MSLAELVALARGRRVVALTGAGCSTDSGIPDYRSPGARPRTPLQHREFVSSAEARVRYWARSTLGWPRMASARPNAGHAALAALEAREVVAGVITQNVDSLHDTAGSRTVVELHGALARVRCLDCGAIGSRDALQARLLAANPGWLARAHGEVAPDGDVELAPGARFEVVGCERCDGVVMPDVVMFGGSVGRPTLDAAWQLFDRAELLLVLGSSLAVFSGFRFVRRAAERGVAIAIVNRGETRGDPLATLRLDAPLAEALPALVTALA
jgi:NAD-dependent SIR2 family protein deacetylase